MRSTVWSVSFIDLIVERQIAEAIARGEMDGGPLKGRPLADATEMRQPGWWAEQLVRRERSRVVHEDNAPDHAAWQRRFWRADDADDVTRMVADANRWIDSVNGRMLDDDAFARFDEVDILARWRAARRPAPSVTQTGRRAAASSRWFRRR